MSKLIIQEDVQDFRFHGCRSGRFLFGEHTVDCHIKSSKLSITCSNTGKITNMHTFIEEYKRVCQAFIDLLWEHEDIPKLLPKDITSSIDSWLSRRALQACAKQASGIIRGTRQKQKQRLFKYQYFLDNGMHRRAKKLKAYIDKQSITKPSIKSLQPELDSRFVKIDLDNDTSFDIWATLTSLGNNLKIIIPLKRTKHFNLIASQGVIKSGIRLGNDSVTFMFDIPDTQQKDSGAIIGLDIGMLNTFSTSDGQQSKLDIHGHDLDKIQQKLSRRKKGSEGFRRAQEHRRNYINWSINQLNLSDVKTVRLENIRHLRKGNKSSRRLSHWTYTIIFDKLDSYCSSHGVHVEKVSPTYTSQRCSQCGWTRKSNRKGKRFKCGHCGFICDADLNASRNIVLPLIPIKKKQRLQQISRSGFYWLVVSQEPIVPDVVRG